MCVDCSYKKRQCKTESAMAMMMVMMMTMMVVHRVITNTHRHPYSL